jgi:hypothetical protein
VREHFFLPPARRAFDAADPDDQTRFDEIIEDLCADPSLAPPLKIRFDVPPVVITLYNDTQYWIAYDLPDEATVRIWMIGKAPEGPQPY